MAEDMSREAVANTGAKGAIYSIGGAGIAKASSLLFYIVLLRFVSASDGGIYFLSLALASMLALAGAFGMGDSLSRFIPYYEGSGKKSKVVPLVLTVGAAFFASSLLMTIVAYFCRGLVTDYYSMELGAVLPETIVLGLALALNGILSSVMLGLKRFGENAAAAAVQPVAKIALSVLFFIYFAPDARMALYATIATVALADLGMLAYVFVEVRKFGGKLELLGFDEIREITAYGISAALNQFSNYLMGWTDTLVLGYYAIAPVVGAYNALIQTARAGIQLASQQIYVVLNSMLSHLHGAKSEMFGPLASNAARWSFYVTLPIAIISVFFAREITTIFFPVYGDYYLLMYAFIPGFFISVFSFPARGALSAIGRTDLLFKSTLAGIIPNAILNLLLVPGYGVWGAVFATVITYIISELIAMKWAWENAGFRLHPMLHKTAVPGVAMAAALAVSYPLLFNYSGAEAIVKAAGVGLACAFSSLVYGIMLVKLGGFNRTDHALVDRVVNTALRAAGFSPRK